MNNLEVNLYRFSIELKRNFNVHVYVGIFMKEYDSTINYACNFIANFKCNLNFIKKKK